MTGVISKNSAEHYTWGSKCHGWFLVKSPKLNIIQERMPGGTSEVLHKHDQSLQFFFILFGTALITINNETFTVHPGEGVEIRPGIAHKITNPSENAEIEFLVISQLPSHEDRINLE